MTAIGDALAALKNVVLMQERIDAVRRELGEVRHRVEKLDDRVLDIGERVVRIETMIEMTQGSRGNPPRIEG